MVYYPTVAADCVGFNFAAKPRGASPPPPLEPKSVKYPAHLIRNLKKEISVVTRSSLQGTEVHNCGFTVVFVVTQSLLHGTEVTQLWFYCSCRGNSEFTVVH